MRYECGHDGCDICGGRRCEGTTGLEKYEGVLVCRNCVNRAIKFTLGIAQQWGGNIIDINKPCA